MAITTARMLSQVIREFRYQQELSQTDVAKLAATKQATVSVFENNPESTKLDTLFKILTALELEVVVQPRHKKTSTVQEPVLSSYQDDEEW